MCVIPCWIWLRKGRSFCLGCFLFLFSGHRHPFCMHLQGFGSKGCKDISEVVLAVQQDAVEEEPVLQGMVKYGEGVIGILGVSVLDGQADGCCPSCQCTSNGIGSGLGQTGWSVVVELVLRPCLWWSDNGQIRKNRGRIQKCWYLENCQSNLLQTWTVYRWGCALPECGIIFVPVVSQGVHRCTKCITVVFLAEKTRNDTTWSVPIVFLSGLNVYSSSLLCEKK